MALGPTKGDLGGADIRIPAIRPATLDDLPAITEIYNEAILTTTATFDTEPKTLADRRQWFENHDSGHPIIVAELDGQVVGWASLSKWSDRLAYSGTAELSVYVKGGSRGRGIGRKLMEEVLGQGEKNGLHTVIARMVSENVVSLHLHESMGFQRIGAMREVGRKFGRLLDVVLMQKTYP